MLHKSAITNIEIYSPEWDKFRIGKFTSSKIVALMPEKGIGSGGMTYIYQKASEFLIGQTLAEDEAIVEAVQHGVRSRFYNQGRYSPTREQGTHHFHRLLAEFLNK